MKSISNDKNVYFIFRWKGKHNLNSKGTTGNPIVDIFNGVELNPKHLKLDWKLQLFRSSMTMFAMLNVVRIIISYLCHCVCVF